MTREQGKGDPVSLLLQHFDMEELEGDAITAALKSRNFRRIAMPP